jgi:hypothetical protein
VTLGMRASDFDSGASFVLGITVSHTKRCRDFILLVVEMENV